MKLGEKIKLVRKHRGLTQWELGERLHLDGNAATMTFFCASVNFMSGLLSEK